jgi:predicted DNA-binding transcriptional regulator AlpA
MFTPTELATRYKVNSRTLRRWVATGEFPRPIVFGRTARWPENIVHEHEQRNQDSPSDNPHERESNGR